jgi:hypothetical protein
MGIMMPYPTFTALRTLPIAVTKRARRALLVMARVLAGAALSHSIFAAPILTATGVADGFSLTTFASDYPASGAFGPLGITFTKTGQVLTSDALGNVRVFAADVDGQHASDGVVKQNYGFFNAFGLASIGDKLYMTGEFSNSLLQINADGTLNQHVLDVNTASGLIANPLNGHLLMSTQSHNQLLDIDPIAGTSRLISSANIDGISLSADGSIVYGANETTGSITGYNVVTGVQVFDSGFLPGEVDGTAVGAGSLADHLFANMHDGTLLDVNLLTDSFQTIVTGGSRGDFVTVDPNNCSVLFTQSDRIMRLSAPEAGSCVFVGGNPGGGGGSVSVAEPGTFALLAVGLLCCMFIALRAQKIRTGNRQLPCHGSPLGHDKIPATVRRRLAMAVATVITLGLAPSVLAQYAITDLGALSRLNDTDSYASAVNASGAVAGVSGVYDPSRRAFNSHHAFLWMPGSANATTGTIVDLGGLPGYICDSGNGAARFDTFANGINSANQVVGY